MMKSTYIMGLLVLLALSVSAATPDGGVMSPFSLGAGARELALGGSPLSSADAVTAPYWNPSRLATAEHYSFGAFHTRLFDSDVTYQYFGVVVPTLDFGSFGLGVFRLGIGGIELRDDSNLLLDELDDNRMGFFLAYGRSFSGYDLGAAVSMESHSLGEYSATSSPGLSLSLARRFETDFMNCSEINLTAISRNIIAPSTELADVSVAQPITAELGVSAVIVPNRGWNQRMTLSMALMKVESVEAEIAMGLEYNFKDMLFVRGGFREDRPCFGLGLTYSVIDFDYALVERDLGSLHMFSITSAFGRSVSERRKTRLEKREAEFANMMEERLSQQNKTTLDRLRAQGQDMLDDEDLPGAVQCFERALFLTRAAGEDTTDISALLRGTQLKLDELARVNNYTDLVDSARFNYEHGKYLEARHFARQALDYATDASDAMRLLTSINRAIEQAQNTEEMLRIQLWQVDSLVSYGEFERAMELLESLEEFAPDDKGVRLATRKVLFEQECQRVSRNYDARNYQRALVHVDSALALMPEHRWCRDMLDKILAGQSQRQKPAPVAQKKEAEPLTAAVLEEVTRCYKTGQELFAEGDLRSAVREWEKVIALAPDYMSVRDYLVKAYKFLGVELYGQNQLVAAIDSWHKAVDLDSNNAEILDYIQRAENEIRKLKELSYETGN